MLQCIYKVGSARWKKKGISTLYYLWVNKPTAGLLVTSYHCEKVLILHNKPHPPPPILLDDTKVGRCKGYFGWQELKVVLKPHPVCQLCGGGHTRNLCTRKERGMSMYA